MRVKFKKLRENAKIPVKSKEGDFCYDVYACDCEEVAPNVYKYPLGFALQIENNENVLLPKVRHESANRGSCLCDEIPQVTLTRLIYEESILSIDFRPRSSVYKTGMVLCNCCGTVDRNYTGEICAFFYHVMPNMPKYEAGDRVAQMKIGFTLPVEFIEVEELDETNRGADGFGSTGLK